MYLYIAGAALYIPRDTSKMVAAPVRPGPPFPPDMRKLAKRLLNNFVINNVLILVGQDHLIKKRINNWRRARFDKTRTLQENVGFSRKQDVIEAVDKVHAFVRNIDRQYLDGGSRVLDIGCGVGLYLKDFQTNDLFGIDMSADFLEQCKSLVPTARTFLGDYLGIPLEQASFDLILSVGVVQYVPPSKIDPFFRKIWSELRTGGLVAIQYPHALNWQDRVYDDLSYVSYTPERIEQALHGRFEVLSHLHAFDARPVRGVDATRYGTDGQRHFANGMLLLARKL